jgi:hypothetical protein
MIALRNKLIFLMLIFSSGAWARDASAPECASWGGVRESKSIYFLDGLLEPDAQSALLDRATDSDLPSWLQIRYEKGALRFENKTPGLGLPFTIYHIRAEWLFSDGRVWEEGTVSFPEAMRCQILSLFPGQTSQSIVIKRPDSQENLRLRIRVWTSFL